MRTAMPLLATFSGAIALSTELTIDLSAPPEQELTKFWQASVGSGHAALGVPGAPPSGEPSPVPRPTGGSLGAMWQAQLKAVHDDTGIYGVRFHGSFDDDMGPVAKVVGGKISYNWTRLDALYDGIMAAGVTPIVELSFMPTVIADCPERGCPTGMHYKGVEAHPKSWSMWYDLIFAFGTHMVQRHGAAEIETWRFEVWNEMWGMAPGNYLPPASNSPYMALFNASHHALKAVSARLSVGGPATAELKDVDLFIAGTKAWGVPLDEHDFVSTHSYPTDACNTMPDSRQRLDCFTDGIIASRRKALGHTFLLTELNCGWKNTAIHDGESKAYAASFMFRTVNALRMHNISALSWWTFSSIFEEGNLPTNEFGPFGANSAMQTVHGVPLPIYRGFQLLADAGDKVLPITSGGKAYNQSGPLTAFATLNSTAKKLVVFLSNFAPDDGKGARVDAEIAATTAAEANAFDLELEQPDVCYKMRPNPCTEQSCWLKNKDFHGGDLLPESKKFSTKSADACCAACVAFKPDKFCQAWSWKTLAAGDPARCYLKDATAATSGAKTEPNIIAGYPTGIAPSKSPNAWYNTSRVVTLSVPALVAAAAAGAEQAQAATVTVRMINATCANPKALWLGKTMNSVMWPSAAQLAALRKASEMCEESVPLVGGKVTVTLEAYAAAQVAIAL